MFRARFAAIGTAAFDFVVYLVIPSPMFHDEISQQWHCSVVTAILRRSQIVPERDNRFSYAQLIGGFPMRVTAVLRPFLIRHVTFLPR
jgi:hypothetical protein